MNKRKISLLLAAVMIVSGLPVEALQAKEAISEVIKEAVDTTALETIETQHKEADKKETEQEISIVRKSGKDTGDIEENEEESIENVQITRQTIEIRTVEEFLSFAQNCHLDAWSYDKLVKLEEDIDLLGESFEPIPVFEGIFEGNGHKISGFNYAGSGYAVGLFRYVGKNGRIENLTLEGNTGSTDEKKCVGGLCGNNEGIIKGCKFSGTVSGRTETGGIAGINQGSGVIENCVIEGRITGYYYTGGITGKNYGNISDCINHANINDSSAWVEEDDQTSGLGWFKSVSEGETTKLQSGVDTGGIAGYSDGIIMSCSNTGIVGYEHTGYNIGGIAGRQSGLLSLNSNKGTVYGRKDVGGIVGQMEPYIKLNKVQSAEEEVQKLHDLINKTLDDMGTAKNTLTADCDNLISYSDGALNKSHTVVTQMSNFVDSNIGAANQIGDRLEYVVGKLPSVLDPLGNSLNDMRLVANDVKKLNEDLHIIGQMEIKDYNETDYRRLSLVTGVGGSLSADNSDPAEGIKVSLSVHADNGYRIKSVRAGNAKGNDISLTDDGNGSYSFIMPRENAVVTAEFEYIGTYLAASSAGGDVSINESSDTLSITAVPFSGYALSEVSIGGVTLSSGGGTSVMVNKSDYPANGIPVLVYAGFVRNTYEGNHDSTYEIECAGGTGGSIISDVQKAAEGSEVRIISTQRPGYRLKSLKVRSGSLEIGTNGTDGGVYTFIMPPEDVVAEAEYEPLRFGMESNAGGTASYTYTVSGNTVKLIAEPNQGYTLSENPAVTGGDGGSIPISRRKANSFEYEFDLTKDREPVKAVMTFGRENQYTSVQSALDGMSADSGELSGAMSRVTALSEEINNIVMNADGTVKDWNSLTDEQKDTVLKDIMELSEQLTAAGHAASSILGNVSLIASVTGPYLSQAAANAHDDIEQAISHVQGVVSYLSIASDGVKGIVNYLNGQQNINFSQLGNDFDQNVDDLYTQLQGISDTMKSLNSDVDRNSDVLNEDFRAVNDQLNVVLLLFLDRMDQLENPGARTIYEDISDEDIAESTQGKVSQCTNKGVVQGDINVGGVAGALSIDEEDPEENAAGSVDISLGSTYLTKCILDGCRNYGYVTAKKDGAGCIAGYMNLGVANNCEAYGGVESTEGDYVGGICGQSLAMIQKCYSLCTLSGGKYVGGIAGYGDAIKNCYSMPDVRSRSGRSGAIAGQAASRENDETLENIEQNYYVGDDLYGIDNISYVGVAEPVTYNELLTTEGLPVDYRHLKVTFIADGRFLGTEEIKYGESLDNLKFPELKDIDNTNGVWPDVSRENMKGNLVLVADYEENITVLASEEQYIASEKKDILPKPVAFAEGEFTGKAVLHIIKNESDIPPHSFVKGKSYAVYDVVLENVGGNGKEEIPLRLLNIGDSGTTVLEYRDSEWKKADTKIRGKYLQVTMKGNRSTFCMVYEDTNMIRKYLPIGVTALLCILALLFIGRKVRGRKLSSKNS